MKKVNAENKPPVFTQLVIWTKSTFKIGGIEQFNYYFCRVMREYYDIIVLYDDMNKDQIKRLVPYVKVMKNDGDQKIICDNLIVNKIFDDVPDNIIYKNKVQMVHSCKMDQGWKITPGDFTVFPSDVAKESFDLGGMVINNPVDISDIKPVLRLISATRLTHEKGEQRIVQLANMLNENHIPFVWMIFSERQVKGAPKGVVYMGTDLNVKNYIAGCDYLVQLSDSESFCYSIVESLCLGVPVITTPLPVLKEIGFEDGVNGFTVPFDFNQLTSDRLTEIYNTKLKFDYHYNNEGIIQQWRKILGDAAPTRSYKYKKTEQTIVVTRLYYDTVLKRNVRKGETMEVGLERAQQILRAGFCKFVDE